MKNLIICLVLLGVGSGTAVGQSSQSDTPPPTVKGKQWWNVEGQLFCPTDNGSEPFNTGTKYYFELNCDDAHSSHESYLKSELPESWTCTSEEGEPVDPEYEELLCEPLEESDRYSARKTSGPWVLGIDCRFADGSHLGRTGFGLSYCEAYWQAKQKLLKLQQEHGCLCPCSCRVLIIERPDTGCNQHCRPSAVRCCN